MKTEILEILKNNLHDVNPFGYAVIDQELNIVYSNDKFDIIFGRYDIENLSSILKCLNDKDAKVRLEEARDSMEELVLYNTNYERKAVVTNQSLHFFPIKNDSNKLMLCIVNDFAESSHWQREFNMLFEKIPVIIAVLDRDFNVVRANDRFKETFGDSSSIYYEQYRKKHIDTQNTPTANVFHDSEEHFANIGMNILSGEKAFFMVNSMPLSFNKDGEVSLVIEISNDITEINLLQEQLHQAHGFYADIIENSADGIIAITKRGKTQIFNDTAKKIFKWNSNRKPGIPKIQEMLPNEFFGEPDENGRVVINKELIVYSIDGEEIPVRFNAFELKNKKIIVGRVAFMEDLRSIRALEGQRKLAESESMSRIFHSLDSNISKIISNQNDALNKFEKVLNSEVLSSKDWAALRQRFAITDLVVNAFLGVAKGYQPTFDTYNLKALLVHLLENFVEFAIFQDISIHLMIDESCDQELNFDCFAIQTIAQIFIANAIEAVSNDDINKNITFYAKVIDNKIIISTKDHSKALKADFIEHLFSTNNSSDTRLGLITVKMIMDKLDGELNVEVEKDFGNTFSVVIGLQ